MTSTASTKLPDRQHVRTIALGLLAVGALLFAALQARSATKPTTPQDGTFEIDAFLGAERCQTSNNQPDELSRRATQLQQMAQARMQRAVFVAGEAVRATTLLAEAELCLRQSNDTDAAEQLHQQWLRWKGDLATRFHGHRLRLDLALKNQRTLDAQTEIRALKALLSGLPSTASNDSPQTKLTTWLEFQQRVLANKTFKK
jgi:hypothetical protein